MTEDKAMHVSQCLNKYMKNRHELDAFKTSRKQDNFHISVDFGHATFLIEQPELKKSYGNNRITIKEETFHKIFDLIENDMLDTKNEAEQILSKI